MINNAKKIKIIVTGGGTGGHIIPLMVVVEELKKHGAKILYIGSGLGQEKEGAKKYNIGYKSVLTGKFRRYFSWQNFIDPVKVVIGFMQSFFIILSFRPDVIFAKGGYVTVPIAYAAWILRKPIIAHETDVVLGLANRLIFNKCKKLCVGFPVKYYRDLPIEKVVYTGNPVKKFPISQPKAGQPLADNFPRPQRLSPPAMRVTSGHGVAMAGRQFPNKFQFPNFKNTKDEGRLTERKTINDQRLTILITGGSQGSRFINQTIAAILPKLTEKYNIIHICGKLDYQWLSKNKLDNYRLYDYTDKFIELMNEADLVISRAGGTIMEIAAFKKPAIIIPLPTAASDHQEANAKVLEENNAAIVLREKNLTSENLLEIINRMMEDAKLRGDLSKQISQFSQPEAAKMITEEILKYANRM